MLKAGQKLNVRIAYVDDEGKGIAYDKRDAIMVSGVLADEVAEVQIQKRLKQGYSARLGKIVKPSENRCEPVCPLFLRCGSCHLQHMQMNAQADWKQAIVERMVKESSLKDLQVQNVITATNPYGYRNKMIIGFTRDKQGVHAGFYEEYSHRIVPMEDCLLHDDLSNQLIRSLIAMVKKLRIEPYQEDRKKGILRHILIRKGAVSGQIMIVLITSQSAFPARGQFVDQIRKEWPAVKTIIQNINHRSTSIVLGSEEKVLFGSGYIEDELCGNTYRISASSFYQINHEQTEVLYQKALSLLETKGNEIVLDTYCGIGTIGMTLAPHVKQEVGVELNKQAVKDAIQNAKRNHVDNIRFVAEDASVYMQKLAASRQRVDVVIMDPPRSGSTHQFIQACAQLKPRAILYISCNPKTQIRDLEVFKSKGYVSDKMYLVDLFPQTNHVESIIKLVKMKSW